MNACLMERPHMLTLEDRLWNWRECMRLRRQAHETPSKESSYRCKQQGHHWAPAAPQGPAAPKDYADAMIIDGAVSALPMKYNIVLRARYVGGQEPGSQRMLDLARSMGFMRPTAADVDAMIGMGKSMLARQLEVPAVVRKTRAEEMVKRILGADEIGVADPD